jgi:hypothetical protein
VIKPVAFSPKTYKGLKLRLHRRYSKLYLKTLSELKAFPEAQVTNWVKGHGERLQEYSAVNWYFVGQVLKLVFFLNQPKSLGGEEFTPEDDAVFEAWNSSEFADSFLKFLNKGMSLGEASRKCTKLFDEYLVSLANLHILGLKSAEKNYRPQIALGDGNTWREFEVRDKSLRIAARSGREFKLFVPRIQEALEVIRTFSPSSWERFDAFTEIIVPINRPEFVSYSHQDLPGTSMINLYNRDFVDLVDDLIHENGHHHLNYYLNLTKLIEEPIDCIYYSPWRRTLRPLRGIYHAYFTFFWAFKLFSDLVEANNLNNAYYSFSEKEKHKILWRAIEEYYMLNYTLKDLKWAAKNKLISSKGMELISEQADYVRRFKSKISNWEKRLKYHRPELKSLKINLSKAESYYFKA